MKKLLGLLGTLTISGSGAAGVIGNAPTPAKNNINYQQTNNLNNIKRIKKNIGEHPLYNSHLFKLSNGEDYLKFLAYCYLTNNKKYNVPINAGPNGFAAGNLNNNSKLKTNLMTMSDNIEFREINNEIINSTKIDNFFNGKTYIENHTNLEQDKVSTMLGYSKSYSVRRGFKSSLGFKAGIKASAGNLLANYETSFELNLGLEYSQDWTEIVTRTVTPTPVRVPAKSKLTVNYDVYKNTFKINGNSRIKIDPNQHITIKYCFGECLLASQYVGESMTLISLINELKSYGYGNNLFNSNKYLTVENNEIFANIPYELTKEEVNFSIIKIGNPIPIN